MSEVTILNASEALQALNRSEIDIQVATAKQYPRDIERSLNTIRSLATIDQETAAECFYSLKRGENAVEGLSVRLAEIFASSWGNIRVQTNIIGNDGRTITARGICHDLETNVAVSVEVKRSIMGRNGQTFNNDMQVVTGNAASAIAMRNAVFKVIPQAITKKIVKEIEQVAIGKSNDLEKRRENMIKWYANVRVTQDMLLSYLKVDHVDAIDNEMVFDLQTLANAIHEGTTTVQETFFAKQHNSAEYAEELKGKAQGGSTANQKAQEAAQQATKKGDDLFPNGEDKKQQQGRVIPPKLGELAEYR